MRNHFSDENHNQGNADPQEVQQALRRLREANRGLQESLQAFHQVLADVEYQGKANGGRLVSANEILESVLAEGEGGEVSEPEIPSWMEAEAPVDPDELLRRILAEDEDGEEAEPEPKSSAKPGQPADGNEIICKILEEREGGEKSAGEPEDSGKTAEDRETHHVPEEKTAGQPRNSMSQLWGGLFGNLNPILKLLRDSGDN